MVKIRRARIFDGDVKSGFDLRLNSLLTSQSYAVTCEPTPRHKDEEYVKIGFGLPPPVPANTT
jgi:hypothetical protein